jgi:hypothetical protein
MAKVENFTLKHMMSCLGVDVDEHPVWSVCDLIRTGQQKVS